MIVDKVDFKGKDDLFELEIEGEKFNISYNTFNELNIRSLCEISFDDYKKIVSEDDYLKAKKKALDIISYSEKTKSEILFRLQKNNFSKESIEKVISFLDEYDFLNDENYAKNYINDKINFSRQSKRKTRYDLLKKGIDNNIIDKYLNEISYDIEYDNCLYIAKKKAKSDFSLKNKQKVYRYLYYKGFEYDIINEVLSEIFI